MSHQDAQSKKRYVRPSIASLGSVTQLTQGQGGSNGDGNLGMTRIKGL